MDKLIDLLGQYGLPALLKHTQTQIALLDASGCLLEWNPAFERLKQASPAALSIQDLLAETSQPIFSALLLAKEPAQASLQLRPVSEKFNLDCRLIPLPDGRFLFFAEPAWKQRDAELMRMADDLKKTRRALRIRKIELEAVLVQAHEVSHTDALTFLPNRRQIMADLQREVNICDRYRKPLSVFMIDIDNFKLINDAYGHDEGDKVLSTLAVELKNSIRQIDKLGRYGGEEFLFLMPNTAIKSGIKMADRLLEIVRNLPIQIESEPVAHISISIGIAQYRIGKESWDDLLKRADKALFKSKANGRDQWTVSNFDDDGAISSRSLRED